MAWRPTQYLIEGELDNTQPGKVTGWMRFAGLKQLVTFDLSGNFHRDIRGAKIRFRQNDLRIKVPTALFTPVRFVIRFNNPATL